MIAVPDEASLAAMRVLGERLGRRCGGSTGTNLWGCAVLISEMAARGETGSIVSLLCDPGRALPRELLRRRLDQGARAGDRALPRADRGVLREGQRYGYWPELSVRPSDRPSWQPGEPGRRSMTCVTTVRISGYPARRVFELGGARRASAVVRGRGESVAQDFRVGAGGWFRRPGGER